MNAEILRNKYQEYSKVSEPNLVLEEIKKYFIAENIQENLALNMLNLQQVWLRMEKLISTYRVDASLEFSFAELLGHYYAAESLLLEVMSNNSTKLKTKQSLKASQELISETAGFVSKLGLVTDFPLGLDKIEGVIKLNFGSHFSDEITRELLG